MNTAQDTAEYTHYFQQAQKDYEKTGKTYYFRKMTEQGDTYMMRVTNNVVIDHIVNHEVKGTEYPTFTEAVARVQEGGWARHG